MAEWKKRERRGGGTTLGGASCFPPLAKRDLGGGDLAAWEVGGKRKKFFTEP